MNTSKSAAATTFQAFYRLIHSVAGTVLRFINSELGESSASHGEITEFGFA